MKKVLIHHPVENMTELQWLEYRKSGIGASEVGAVLGLDPYKSSIALFYEKIEPGISYTIENMAMFMGTEMEDFIATRLWPYWEGNQESVVSNYRAGIIQRKCQRVRSYVRNPDYPWLFVSLDRKINKEGKKGEGALEIKTIGGWEADKWEAGIPPKYIMQVQTQIMVCDFKFGELAILQDGRNFDVLPFDLLPNVCDNIAKSTKVFWDKVQEGRMWNTRKYEAQRNFNQRLVEECDAAIHSLEPPPDGSDAYSAFVKEKYAIAVPGEQAGTPKQLLIAKHHNDIKAQIKKLNEEAKLAENTLKMDLRDHADVIDFGKDGYVSWKSDVNKIRRFLNKAK